MKILYAEDELGLSMAVAEVLKMEGFEVTSVMDGLSADEILQKEHFDMVVLDIMMPGMEGTQVAENMRKRSDYTPVLLLTAKAETDSTRARMIIWQSRLPWENWWRASRR